MTIAPHLLRQVLDLYERGLYLQAYRLGQALGPLDQWEGTNARLIAGRLAVQLGAQRLQKRLHRRAWREDRTHPEARYYRARIRLEQSGPLAAWELLSREGDLPEAAPELRAIWFSFRATVAALLRDFAMADASISQAEQLAPDHPWIGVERAMVLELEDRYEEALTAARRALAAQPWHRAGVEITAHVLQLLNRDAEALELLAEAAQQIESAAVVAQLTLVQTERGCWADAGRGLDRFEELSPLMEEERARWLAGRRADVAYHCGDLDQAIRFAQLAGDPFHQTIAERLRIDNPNSKIENPKSEAVLLPVGFVRQHHMTCVPATLSALSRFWSMPADHLSVAEAICYDGTSAHSERSWAEQNGWIAREFTVTWESAVALLDRGIPFTLTTSNPTNAHEQAVIGYDPRLRTLQIRDPYQRHFGEFLADEGLQQLRSTGPRGMALVPREQAALLDRLELPEADLYDRHHELQRALLRHDRPEAQRLYDALQEVAPGHRLTLQARRSLAAYDSDPTELLACAERLLELFPDDGALQLLQLSCLRDLARREERLALLQILCGRKSAHPVFWQQYAQELAPDAREHPAALRLLRRAIRAQPGDGGSIYLLARILWDQRRFDEALGLFRIAACLDEKNEAISQGYFFASRHLRQTGATLKFLNDRFRRFGARSSQPARTLFWALCQIDQTTEAFQLLDTALSLRPEDGDLRLFAAEADSRHGEFDRAAAHLAAAEGKAQRTAWLRTAAQLSLHRGDLMAALSLQRQVVAAEPLDGESQRSVTQLIAATDCRAAALDYLRGVVARFPHHYRLHQLWIEWLREEDQADREAAIRDFIEINPADDWAHRELALALAQQRRFEEALAESEVARRLDPTSPAYFCVHGQICAMAGQMAEARAAYRQAIRLSVDTDFAIGALVDACDSPAERREALAFIENELIHQTIMGQGLLAFREQARQILAPEELLASLRKALAARPDLWHAWSAVACQMTGMDRLEEALGVARQATERFPLLPQLWVDLAHVHQARGDRTGEREALQHALRISPGWGAAVAQMASLHERSGESEQAKTILEQAIARTPLDPVCRGWLAQILWRLGEKEAALEQVEQALELEPGYDWAWGALQSWSQGLEGAGSETGRAAAFARRLAARRPGEARSWLMLARMLAGEEALPERLAALDRAIALDPRLTETYEMKAELLARASRFEEALAACRPELPGSGAERPLPVELRARAAWVEAERGNRHEAISQMCAVVADDSRYYHGWAELARWYGQTGAAAEYLNAAQKMAELQPQNPHSSAMLADARLRAHDRRGAKGAFRRAFELAPNYTYAGMALFDLQLEDGELQEAGETLQELRTHGGGERVLARETQLAARRRDRETAVRCLRDLCVEKAADPWPYQAAVSAMAGAGWGALAAQILDEALERSEVNPQIGALWVRSHLPHRGWHSLERLEERLAALEDRGAVGREAILAYAQTLGEAGNGHSLRTFLNRHSGVLRGETSTWAKVGHALLAAGDLRRTARWLSDWQSRPGLKPGMLVPLVVALRAADRDSEAAAVSWHALTLEKDERSGCHAIWLAVDAALTGAPDQATPYLAQVHPAALNAYYRFLHALAQAAIEVQSAAGERARALTRARPCLRAAAPPSAEFRCPALRRAHRRLLRRLARDVRGPSAALWAWFEITVGWLRGPARPTGKG